MALEAQQLRRRVAEVRVTRAGFSWRDAGIGFAASAGLVLVLSALRSAHDRCSCSPPAGVDSD
jgi:hypothetical protein